MMICDFESPHALLLSFNKMCWFKNRPQARLYVLGTGSNQIRVVAFNVPQLTQASFLQKKSNVAKWFFDIFNAEIAQPHQELDVILGTKVVQF